MKEIIENTNSLNEPYIHFTFEREKLINLYTQIDEMHKQDTELFTTIIEGRKCVDKKGLFEEFSSKLNFPDYFGQNWDAFNDCMNDLEWQNSKRYVLCIHDFDLIFSQDDENLEIFLEVLSDTIIEWTSGREYGEFITPPTPFHVIGYCNRKDLNKIESKLDHLKIEIF